MATTWELSHVVRCMVFSKRLMRQRTKNQLLGRC